jgi:hypothetical protein
MTLRAIRLYVMCATALLLFVSSRVDAQYRPRRVSSAAVGENYGLEISAAWFNPAAEMSIASTAGAVTGTTIDLKNDLGLQDRSFGDFHLILRPNVRHKFRVELVPIKYSQTATPKSSFVFAGQTYVAGIPVASTINWKAWRFGYEYDFAVGSRGFMGMIVDVKYTDVSATLSNASGTQSTSVRAPIPAFGGILRVYPAARLGLTAELSGFKLPGSWIKSESGHYLDVNLYATVNVVNAFGVQGGYRSFDLSYTLTNDTGSFTLKGPYVGAVVRF